MIDTLYQLASEFRIGIEECKNSDNNNPEWFSRFPRGRCGDASDLLMYYFKQNGIESRYVSGSFNNQTHGWLEADGLFIDITADQFEDIDEVILIIGDYSWHSKFEGFSYRDTCFDEFNEYAKERLFKLYNEILERIKF